jgi:hypothetical protein
MDCVDMDSESKKARRTRANDHSSEATEGDMDESDLFDKKWTMEKDPWSTRTVPAEPIPEMYSSFEGRSGELVAHLGVCFVSDLCCKQRINMPHATGRIAYPRCQWFPCIPNNFACI